MVKGNSQKTVVAVDAMGGDHAPGEIVKGAIESLVENNIKIVLVGDAGKIEESLESHGYSGDDIEIIQSVGVIEESEQPALALRKNPKASVAISVGLVSKGYADAVVSMGSTGALMTSAFFGLGMIEGIDRPVLGGPFLGYAPNMICLDMGSNVDAKPRQYLNFAAIGTAMSRTYLGIKDPTVGLLNVGTEPSKGSKQVKEAYQYLESSKFNFIGNIEAHEMVNGKADIILCDGFVGNILLKYSEGLALLISEDLRKTLSVSMDKHAAEDIANNVFRKISVLDNSGGPILGINGVAIVGHGRGKSDMVKGVIKSATDMHERRVLTAIHDEISRIQISPSLDD